MPLTLGATASARDNGNYWPSIMDRRGPQRPGRPLAGQYPGLKFGKYRSFDLGNKYTVSLL